MAAGLSAAHADDSLPMGREPAAKIAARAIDTASALADLLDVGRSDLGANPTMEAALAHAREIAPKPLEGMAPWAAGPQGAVRARVSEPMLCRALMDQCRAKSRSEPNACACQPDGEGAFVFLLRINALDLGGALPAAD